MTQGGTISSSITLMIADAARNYTLPVDVLVALVLVESSGNPWAYNPEPHYRYLVDIRTGKPFRPLSVSEIASERPPDDFPSLPGVPRDAEWWGQQASWGLLQVMGAVARENGFSGKFLTELCDPWTGLDYGARHLRHQLNRYGDLRDAVVAYNTGNAVKDASGTYSAAGVTYLAKVENRREKSV